MLQVRAHLGGVAVDELGCEVEMMEVLVPELALKVGVQHAPARAGDGWADHDRAYAAGRFAGDRLGDAAADVVPRDHRTCQAQLVDQAEDAARLRRGGVPSDGVDWVRSEEHTSELQSQSNLVCRLLL